MASLRKTLPTSAPSSNPHDIARNPSKYATAPKAAPKPAAKAPAARPKTTIKPVGRTTNSGGYRSQGMQSSGSTVSRAAKVTPSPPRGPAGYRPPTPTQAAKNRAALGKYSIRK